VANHHPVYPNIRQPYWYWHSHKLFACLLLLVISLVYPIPFYGQNALVQISIQPATELRADFISDVDVLFVYDNALLNQLPFTQFDWISSKEEYLDRAGNQLELVQFRISAQTELQQVLLSQQQNQAIGILVFASHEDPVAEAIDITSETKILLQIESYGINVLQD